LSALEVAEVPFTVVTVTSTVPAVWGGATAVMDVVELTVKLRAGTLPKATPVMPTKLLPVIVSETFPEVLIDVVDRLLTVGAGAEESETTTRETPVLVYRTSKRSPEAKRSPVTVWKSPKYEP
jgi:hypothetical protein